MPDEHSDPLLPDDPLQVALDAYHALNAELRWEFLKEIAADSCKNSQGEDTPSAAAIPSDDPYWEEYQEIVDKYREPDGNT